MRNRYLKAFTVLTLILLTGLLSGCSRNRSLYPDDKYGTCYEVFVYSFADSNGDGIGDIKGLIQKLDYINDGKDGKGNDLEVNELWLMPIFASPSYHKYDTMDYMSVDPDYGTTDDFKKLLKECHKRGVKVILDLALNHTSIQHPWFYDHPEYYNFSDVKKDGYACISTDTGDRYYEARFYEGMPDLDLDSKEVRKEIEKITGYWLDMGVDGFRLDAVSYYFSDDTAKNVEFLKWFKDMVQSQNKDVYLVGECYTAQDTYSKYYASGIDSLFDFAFSGPDGIIASVVKGNRSMSVYAQSMEKEEALYESYYPGYINAPFYTNHDMGRSAGYYAYDDGTKTKFAGALNLLMTGNAFIYYGEETGMKGSGKDENKRAPMQWGDDEYMCRGPEGMEMPDMKFGSVSSQTDDPASILNYYRKAVVLRNSHPVIARGKTYVVSELTGDDTCAFIRTYDDKAEDSASDNGNVSGAGSQKEGRSVMIVINGCEEQRTLMLPDNGYCEMTDQLITGEDEPFIQGNELTMPPYSIAVFKNPS
ncbi:MAG: alpha-amylase [Lachnospiraceae bacterium]|nr:alpha-amylase [Lachnospiraceae bacterium]